MKGSRPLLAAITLVWAVVWLFTQVIVSTPLSTTPTILIGVAATLLAVWGYQTTIRGPRRLGGISTASLEHPSGDPLMLVNRTLPYLRNGLTGEAADRTAKHLLPLTGGHSVQITDTEHVLGTAGNHGQNGSSAEQLSDQSLQALYLGKTIRRPISGGHRVATPLRLNDQTIGTIAVDYLPDDEPPLDRMEAVANLVTLHVEIAELTEKAQLAADARLDALRAQINPHFLFNTLNTIAAKARTDPNEARRLLQRLADFFRYATQQEGQFAEFAHEYFFVRTYLSLEQARFDERLHVRYDIDPQVLAAQIPVLMIQPLVENAVKHGLAPKPGGGTLNLRARVDPLAGAIRIDVRDDGVGMDRATLAQVADGSHVASSSSGVGLRNIHERLQRLYGARYHLDIRSTPQKGTRIELELPL